MAKYKIYHLKLFFLLLTFTVGLLANSQEFNRRAIYGFSYDLIKDTVGVKITSVESNAAVFKSGLQTGDILISIEDNDLMGYEDINRIMTQLPSGKVLEFVVLRKGRKMVLKSKLEPLPEEKYEHTTVEYNGFNFHGETIRTIISKSKVLEKKKLPAVMLVQWLSCGSIEILGEPADGMDYVIKSFANNPNIIFYRVEKNGVGDSRGTACIDLDAQTEIATYKQALKKLKKRADVDTTQIYLLGLSLGTSLAPIVGESEHVKGYMVSGGSTVTWFEHMLAFERNRLTLSETFPEKVNKDMKSFSDFYYRYLIQKKTPEEIIKESPDYQNLWYDEPRHQFGRSARYYQQIQDVNFEKAWSQVKVPVLAIYGEYDWVMDLRDHQRIVDLVNQNNPNHAILKILPKTGHLLSTYPTLKDSFEDEIGVINPNGYKTMWSWLEKRIQTKQ